MWTVPPHRAHAKTRPSAAATAPASRGLYKSRGARDPGPGSSGPLRHRSRVDQGGPGRDPGPPPSEPPSGLPHLEALTQLASPHVRWVTSREHTPGVSRERLSNGPWDATFIENHYCAGYGSQDSLFVSA